MKHYSLILILILFTSLNADNLSFWKKPKHIPQPKNNPITSQKTELGRLLFFDPRLSKSGNTSCATCHNPFLSWTDGISVAIGEENKHGKRNSPTILNTAYLNTLFHDSRASSLEEQALGPIQAEEEMNMPIEQLVEKLSKINGYQELFNKAFNGEGVSKENILKAIATFERTLISDDAPFDKWVNGDENSISKEAKIGYSIYMNEGKCRSCHIGFNFTNEKMVNIGLGDEKDLGVYDISKTKSKVWYANFKTPTLRNIEKTAPYFHNGSVKTLKEAVEICGNGGKKPVKTRSPFFVDRQLNNEDVEYVTVFLKTLTSESKFIDIPSVFPK